MRYSRCVDYPVPKKGNFMDIRILEQSQSEDAAETGTTLEVELGLDDMARLKEEAARALEIERSLPPAARTELADASEDAYVNDFIKTRATNDALEAYGIVPLAAPRVKVLGLKSGALYTCVVNVVPRPEIGLTSLDPVDLKTNRVVKPGFSAKAAQEGAEGIEFLEDEKTLRIALVERLDSEFSESEMRALGDEYQDKFEKEMERRNIDPESYRVAHSLDEEQYALMMARRALADAHWNCALDAVFVGVGLEITEQDLADSLEREFPGCSRALLEVHELRNDLYLAIEKVRRAKALEWLLENAVK